MEEIRKEIYIFKTYLEGQKKGFRLKNIYLISIKDRIKNNKKINNIKFITKLSEIEDQNIEIVNYEILSNLNYTKEQISEYELSFMKISDKINQIIFKDKSKLNIINNKKLQFIEAPNPAIKFENNKYNSKNNDFLKINIIKIIPSLIMIK